jgi:hypothetical protein
MRHGDIVRNLASTFDDLVSFSIPFGMAPDEEVYNVYNGEQWLQLVENLSQRLHELDEECFCPVDENQALLDMLES